MQDLLNFLPEEKRKILLQYPFVHRFLEGKLKFKVFLEDLEAFKQDLMKKGITESDISALRGSILRNHLLAHIEQIGKEYNFQSSFGIFPEDNKAFLTMLDYYMNKIKCRLPSKINAMDFGSGHMPYADGLGFFLMRYGRKNKSDRQVNFLLIEPAGDAIGPGGVRGLLSFDEMWEWVKSKDDIKNYLIRNGWQKYYSKFNFVAMFALGGYGLYVAKGLDYLSPIIQAINEVMKKDGLLVITITPGGQDKIQAIKVLKTNKYEILLGEDNIYEPFMTELGYAHEFIIIAKYKG